MFLVTLVSLISSPSQNSQSTSEKKARLLRFPGAHEVLVSRADVKWQGDAPPNLDDILHVDAVQFTYMNLNLQNCFQDASAMPCFVQGLIARACFFGSALFCPKIAFKQKRTRAPTQNSGPFFGNLALISTFSERNTNAPTQKCGFRVFLRPLCVWSL